jgi:alpha-L-rhamnosidase
MRTEYRTNPIGIDVAMPRLDYQLESQIRRERQSAYRIVVASSESNLAAGNGDLWDSGKVTSDQTSQIVYRGKPLAARQSAWWKVKVWDQDDAPSDWSPTASWEMGLLAPSDWQAQWISTANPSLQTTAGVNWIWYPEGDPATSAPAGSRLFRRTFVVPAGASIKGATVAITADNTFDVRVNGVRAAIGSYWKNLRFVDVTALVSAGPNTLAVLATNLDTSPAGLLAQITVDLGAGAPLVVSSDGSFRSSNQPPPQGWDSPTYDDSGWPMATVAAPYGQGPWTTLPIGMTAGGPARYLRRSFDVAKTVRKARLYATSLGVYEASINGSRVSAEHLAPGWTAYAKRLQVQSYDVTAAVQAGPNVLGLTLGDGWYKGKIVRDDRDFYGFGPSSAFAQLEIEYSDGTLSTIATDASWSGSNEGPILTSDLVDGETYDARREIPNWNGPGPGFTSAGWKPAVIATPARIPRLVAQPTHGMQVDTELAAKTMTKLPSGVFIYDLGQNMVGWSRLRVNGPRGATIVLRHAEVLNADGSLYTDNLRSAAQTERYTLRGGAEEIYEPHFTLHGFRYVELSGDVGSLASPPSLGTLTGIVVHDASPTTGTITTSDPNLNQLQSNIVWTQKGNFTAVPTGCPQRDERDGWTGDALIFAKTSMLNMDVAAFFTKWLRDIDDAQDPNGSFEDVAPNPPFSERTGTPAWADAGVVIPWDVYLAYGDTRILEENYAAMKAWVDYAAALNAKFLWHGPRGGDYGDWLNVNQDTDREVIGTAFFAQSASIVGKAAAILGNSNDAAKYAGLSASIRDAFINAYVSGDGHIKSNSQTVYALALRFGLVPDALRPAVAALLKADIMAHAGHLTTGFVGVSHLLPALSGAGMTDTAYGVIQIDGYPSWRYEIDRGATTIWERWDGIMQDGRFEDIGMNSFNHYAYGSVGEWMYGTIGGLEPDETKPGWKQFRVRPQPGGGLTSARVTLDSIHGKIVSDWNLRAGLFALSVTIPVNTTATVYPPYTQGLTLDGQSPPTPSADGGYNLGSGTYLFTARAP